MIFSGGTAQFMCYCDTGYYFDTYIQLCTAQKSEGMVCYSSGECVDNATCTNNVCACYPGYWSNPTTGECDLKLSYNATCSISAKTVPCNYELYGINCFNSLCGCDPVLEYWSGSYCAPRLHYGETTCTTTVLCATYRGFTCSSGQCVCSSGLGWNGNYYYCT